MKLFRSPLLHSDWIACTADDRWFKFPAQVDGWEQRAIYMGDRKDLIPVAPWSAFNTGFPHPDALLRGTHHVRALAAAMAA
jgi:hypothetical protein